LMREGHVFSIPKTSDAEHVAENGGASDVRLSDEDVENIDRIFPVGSRRGGVPVL